MGNLNLIWDAFVANVECCRVGYEIRRVFTQPGPEAAFGDTYKWSGLNRMANLRSDLLLVDSAAWEKRMSKIKGCCACGAVSYSLTDSPKFSYLCQCHQCQKATGSGHAALLMVRADALDIAGSLQFYDQPSDSDNTMSRGFCSKCGTPIMLRSSGYPELRFLTAGSLDDPDEFRPSQVLWHSAGQHWDIINAELKVNENGL